MFENDGDIDFDDEFLNIAFENEEAHINNKPLAATEGLSTNDSTVRKCMLYNAKNKEAFHEPDGCDFSSRTIENTFLRSSGTNSIQQGNAGVLGNKENKRNASPPPLRTKRERKFPGPAGLLPDRKSLRGTPFKLDIPPDVESPSVSTPEELCSQGRLSGSVLQDGPWRRLLSDLGPHADVLDTVNVASVKRKAAARCFVGRKVPFLAAALHHLDVSSADPCIILRDRTGEIHGTLHREVWQQFAAELVVGSVLVIRNVGLLSTGLSSRRHYLNITSNNLATIYSANPEKSQKREVYSLTSNDYKRTIEDWKTLLVPPRTTGSPASPMFNTSLSSLESFSPMASSPQMNNVQPRCNGPLNLGVRSSTSQLPQHCRNLPGEPSHSKANPLPKPPGRNLFTSHSNSNNSQQVRTLNSSSVTPGSVRPHCSTVNRPSPNTGKNMSNNSFSHSAKGTENVQTPKNGVSCFKFDPVIVKTNSNGTVYSQNVFGNQSTVRSSAGNNCVNNSPRIILSQSSQLTAEEQSVVESMFEGIDADSLFDDDF